MSARVIYVDMEAGIEEIAVGAHSIELSPFGDTWCHTHDSGECIDELTEVEFADFSACQLCAA
jgi:hypothetical protein